MRNLPLKIKFIVFTGAFFAIFMIFISIFTVDTIRYNRYKNYSNEIQKIKVGYLDLRQLHQKFLIQYEEDGSFFKTGKNQYLRQSELKSKELIDQIHQAQELRVAPNVNADIKLNEVAGNLENIELLMAEIALKNYRRGSKTTGIVGEMQRAYEYIIENTNDKNLKEKVNLLRQKESDYLLSKDLSHYKEFLTNFVELNSFLANETAAKDTALMNDSINFNTVQISKKVVDNLNNYKKEFTALVNIDKELGFTKEEGLYSEMQTEVDKISPALQEIDEALQQKINSIYKSNIISLTVVSLVVILVLIILVIRFSHYIVTPVNQIKDYIFPLRKGILPKKLIEQKGKDELADISNSINKLIKGLKETTNFAKNIGEGNFATDYQPLSEKDVLGNSLLQMRQNLQEAKIRDEKREKEDTRRKWVSDGVAKFADILRQTTKDINELSSNVIKNLVAYLHANQGGVFLYNDEDKDDIHLELIASYAYNKERKKKKRVMLGEGLIGTCAIEKAPIYMTDIPNDYITITSGLGGANPRSILIVPLKLEEQILGVIEIASFNKLEEHEREFVERVTESIASTLSITRINERTTKLLAQSQKQTEEMHAQEEEMRQNLEELKATQEESNRREIEMKGVLNALNNVALVSELDLEGNIISANSTLLKVLDVFDNKYIGHNIAEFREDNENIFVTDKFVSTIQSGGTFHLNSVLKINNQKFYFEEYYTGIFDQYNEIEKIICISYNQTNSVLEKEENISKTENVTGELKKITEKFEKLESETKEKDKKIDEINLELAKSTEQNENLKSKLKKSLKAERELFEKINVLNTEIANLKSNK